MSVTSAYIECATGKWYHLIVLADGFLLGYRYWTFAKTSASALWKKLLMFSIATAGCMTGVFSATCAAYEEIVRAIVAAQWVVRAQWSEHWHLKSSVLGLNPNDCQLSTFSLSPCNTISSWVWSSWSEETMNIQLHTICDIVHAPTPVWLKLFFPNQILFTTLTLTANNIHTKKMTKQLNLN